MLTPFFSSSCSLLYPASCTCMTSAATCKIKAGVSSQCCWLERNRNYIASYPRVCCLMFSERGKKAPQAVRQTAKLKWDIFWCSEVVRTAQRHLNLMAIGSIPVWRIVLFLFHTSVYFNRGTGTSLRSVLGNVRRWWWRRWTPWRDKWGFSQFTPLQTLRSPLFIAYPVCATWVELVNKIQFCCECF